MTPRVTWGSLARGVMRQTIRDRNANAWAVFGRRAHCSSVVTSSALSTSGDNFEDGMPQPKNTARLFMTHDTSE